MAFGGSRRTSSTLPPDRSRWKTSSVSPQFGSPHASTTDCVTGRVGRPVPGTNSERDLQARALGPAADAGDRLRQLLDRDRHPEVVGEVDDRRTQHLGGPQDHLLLRRMEHVRRHHGTHRRIERLRWRHPRQRVRQRVDHGDLDARSRELLAQMHPPCSRPANAAANMYGRAVTRRNPARAATSISSGSDAWSRLAQPRPISGISIRRRSPVRCARRSRRRRRGPALPRRSTPRRIAPSRRGPT